MIRKPRRGERLIKEEANDTEAPAVGKLNRQGKYNQPNSSIGAIQKTVIVNPKNITLLRSYNNGGR
jgi:hypothetical protein